MAAALDCGGRSLVGGEVLRGARTRAHTSPTGGFGYLLTDRVLEVGELFASAERVARGGSALDPQVVASLVSPQQVLVDAERLDVVYRPLRIALAAAAAAALAAGWARPAPWLFGLALVMILSVLWIYAASRFLRTDAWST